MLFLTFDLHLLIDFLLPGVSSVNDSEHQISELESILDSQVPFVSYDGYIYKLHNCA